MRFFRIILFLIFTGLSLGAMAQSNEGYILVKNSPDGKVMLKWVGRKVLYEGGFNIYKKSKGNTAWTKINAAPINLMETLPSKFDSDKEVQGYYKIAKETPLAEFQQGVPRAFVLVKAIFDNEFGKVLGIAWDDADVRSGSTYDYRVMAIENGSEIEIGTASIEAGQETTVMPPSNIRIERKRKQVDFFWDAEPFRYYGVNVYRTDISSNETVLINHDPVILSSEEEDGERIYPELKYTDKTIEKDKSYKYVIKSIDFFGDESIASEPIAAAAKDMDPPLPAFNLDGETDTLRVLLTWSLMEDADRNSITLYRGIKADEEMEKIETPGLAKNDSAFTDEVPVPGGYYYRIGTKDLVGNEALSSAIFIDVRDVVAPDAPVNLKAIADSGQVHFSWTANKETDLLGYFIYKAVNDGTYNNADFVLVNPKPIKTNTYTEKMAKNIKNSFVYKVAAVDTSFNYSLKSEVALVKMPDINPPEKPFIRDILARDGNIEIAWVANADADLAGYNVYRKTSGENNPAEKVNLLLISVSSTRFTDRFANEGVEYSYYLEAVDDNGNVSKWSEPFTAMIRVEEEQASEVNKFKILQRRNSKKASLYWDVEKREDYLGVVVYRSEDGINFKPYSGLLTGGEFDDKDVEAGKTYYYKLKTFNKSGIKADSEMESILIK